VRRGDVSWADIVPRSRSEQSRRRPVVVVSHDGFNQTTGWRSVIVVPLSTSSSQAKRGPTVVAIPAQVAGLTEAGTAICDRVTTLDRAKLTARIGTLPDGFLADVENGLRAALNRE